MRSDPARRRLSDDPRFADIAEEVGLRAIEQLAGTDRSVTQIAMDVGYSSLSAFQSAFRDLTDETPSEYRAGFAP